MADNKKKSKNQWRREQAKLKKQQSDVSSTANSNVQSTVTVEPPTDHSNTRNYEPDIVVENVQDVLQNPQFEEFKNVFSRFQGVSQNDIEEENEENHTFLHHDDDPDFADEKAKTEPSNKIGKKKLRQMNKIPLAQLKTMASHPELVEWYDADAPNPKLLVNIKSQKSIVPVPDHWQSKSEYLSGKRGSKKSSFELPDYIKATGIMEMRSIDGEDSRTLRQTTRDRVQPKLGKFDIDYQKLHDAFFKFQKEPKMYKLGLVYYEGKEEENDYSRFRAGKLSKALVEALNIPPNAPPPWLLNMQRYGPPPSYPGLKIPGLNAPIPPGAQWGFQPGGYGKPALDDDGKPLYGDLYGINEANQKVIRGAPIEKQRWGQALIEESEEEEESEDEEGEDEDEEKEGESNEIEQPEQVGVHIDQSESAAVADTDDQNEEPAFELRKNPNKKLFQVLEQKNTSGGFLGSQTTYEIPSEVKPEVVTDTKIKKERDNTAEKFQSDLSSLIDSESKKRDLREEEVTERKPKRSRWDR